MTKYELVSKLKELQLLKCSESTHIEADELLLKYINDKDIADAFYDIDKWYS